MPKYISIGELQSWTATNLGELSRAIAHTPPEETADLERERDRFRAVAKLLEELIESDCDPDAEIELEDEEGA